MGRLRPNPQDAVHQVAFTLKSGDGRPQDAKLFFSNEVTVFD